MDLEEVDILLVEDNPTDAELTMRALKKKNLANQIVWVKDGEKPLILYLPQVSSPIGM